jgi:hypothetical protein
MARGTERSVTTPRLTPCAVERLEVRQLLSVAVHGKSPAHALPKVPTATQSKSTAHSPKQTTASTKTTATARPIADPHFISSERSTSSAAPSTYSGLSYAYGSSPTVIRSAYGLGAYGSSTLTFGGVQGDGTGQTIAIVDAYNDPNAAGDLNAFSTYFGLPTLTSNTTGVSAINSASGPTFSKISQSGSFTSLPPTDPAGPYSSTGGDTWEQEESLDIEWAHVMAPKANILLVEAADAYDSNLYAGVTYARGVAGVVAVSMSFGESESSVDSTYDADLTTPSGHVGGAATAGGAELTGGVTFLASAGDSGAYAPGTTTITPQYPAASPNVVAVGGTTLNTSGNTYVGESAWGNGTASGTTYGQQNGGGGGGGISAYEAQPSYQASTVSAFSTTHRTYPDLSIEADPNTGVPIYDSWDFGTATPWIPGTEGGTSLASPMMAGLVAVADQDRAVNGLGSLYGTSGTLTNIYAIASSNYHDITSGSNGYAAGTGYDLATGRGSPIANLWVVAIAAIPPATGTVSGQVFRDTNGNGTFDGTDAALSGLTVYLDENNDGTRESTEPQATTSAMGTFSFTGLAAGVTGTVRLLPALAGYAQDTTPTFTVTSGGTSTANLGEFPTAYTDATAGDAWTLRASPSSSNTLQVLVNGTVTYTAPVSLPTSLLFALSGSADTMAVDFGNGVPVPSGGITVNGTSAGNGDTLSVLGTTGNDAIAVNAATVVFGSSTISYSSMPNLSVEPRTGTDALAVNSGTVSIPAQTAGAGFLARTFSSLSVAAGAKLTVGTTVARTDRTVVVVTTPANLSIAGTGQLDLGGNDLIVRGGSLSTLFNLAKAGYANGAWTGTGGLTSNVAAANAAHTTGLGVIQASSAANTTTFDGQSISAADVLVKYTYYGDANLDGTVNIADYTRTDAGFLTTGASGWSNGDYDYDGVVDGSDYTLMDNAFNGQSTVL